MKFTLSWLKDHLETNASLAEITDKLVTLGLEVESVEDPAEKLKGFVVGQVIKREKHPNADRLNLCRVDDGTGELIQVICGAHNVREGMKVVFAPLGTVIPESGDILKKGKIRDIESFGMMCSSRELLLGTDHDGIIDLDTDAAPGTPFTDICEDLDPVIDLSITPNRPDCFGVRGIARDLAASGLGKLKPLTYPEVTGAFESPINVEIQDSAACDDFRGVYIRDVNNTVSPDWVQLRLKAIGLRPINALVDVTNYLNIDLCRPLHVFDADKIQGNLQVGLSKKGQTINALNEKTYELEENMIAIWDDSLTKNNEVLSIAGIMGGTPSSCSEETKNVFLECAAFDPIMIAQTGRNLQILSDSRTRFERGVDPESLDFGVQAAVKLILDWCGGKASHICIAKHIHGTPEKPSPRSIELTQHKLWSLSGYEVSLQESKTLLENLGFKVTADKKSLTATVPSHRPDVEGPADLVEEILRLIGYDNIPAVPLPQITIAPASKSPAALARQLLASRGFFETITWSFVAKEKAELFNNGKPLSKDMELSNPISVELSTMRPSILPNLIEAAGRNKNRGYENTALFEVGPIFGTSLPFNQTTIATGLRSGKSHSRHWLDPLRDVDTYDAKADVLSLLNLFGLKESNYQIEKGAADYYHPGRSGTLKQGNKILAYFGEIHPKVAQAFDVDSALSAFEVFLENLPPIRQKKTALTLSPYQSVTRDFAFIMDKSVSADTVVRTIQKVDKSLITSVEIFDVYEGDKIAPDKKSLAIEVRFDPQTGTMSDEQIQTITTTILNQVEKVTGATLRQ